MEKVRIDKYLWAIRIFKTRSLASNACENGKVKWNGNAVKASKNVQLGEEYEVKAVEKKVLLKVVGLIDKRVAHPEAIKNYMVLDDFAEELKTKSIAPSFFTGKRMSKIGRPSKKEGRELNDFFDKNLNEE